LEKLTILQLEKLYRQKLGEGLSARRVRYIHATIRKALKDAVRLQLLPRNVADAAIPPKATKSKVKPLTQDQLRTLLDAAKGDKLEALYVLAITTGMRQGELLGLQWKDIDLDAGTLRVNRSVYDGEIHPPKTEAGNRTIKLPKLALVALKQHRVSAAKQRIAEWVFPNVNGGPIGHQNLHNRSWKPLLHNAGLPTPRGFTTCATPAFRYYLAGACRSRSCLTASFSVTDPHCIMQMSGLAEGSVRVVLISLT
jgi:integrase